MTTSLTSTTLRARRAAAGPGQALACGVRLALGVSMIWFSLLVLIPLVAVVIAAAGLGCDGFWDVITHPQTRAALRLTVVAVARVTAINVVMGTVLAWVLVRDRFWGKRAARHRDRRAVRAATIVAGLVLLVPLRTESPLGVNVANTRIAVFLALAFVTLPFVVRTVQPVLESLERDVEEAAASLGASRLTTFRRVILPTLAPAIAAGAALSFARGDQRVRLAGAALGQPARPDRGRVGARAHLHRERQPGGRVGCGGDPAAGRAARDRGPRPDPAKGGPPWRLVPTVRPATRPVARWGCGCSPSAT